MIAGFSECTRFPIFLSFSLSVLHTEHKYTQIRSTKTHTETHTNEKAIGANRGVQIAHLESDSILFAFTFYSLLPFSPFFCCFFVPVLIPPLSGVCASISCPHCPISCHPFTRPSSLCHHQGPTGLLHSASREKGLYLSNAPSNHSS